MLPAPRVQQPSCAAVTCTHAQQYWPVWVCAISAGGALVAKGYYDRWDVAGGFVGIGVIVSLAISCFAKQARPLTPNTIREHRHIVQENYEGLVGVVADQNVANQQLADEVQALEEGRVIAGQNLERQRSAAGHLGNLVEGGEQDRVELARIAEEQRNNQAAAQELAQGQRGNLQELQDANSFLSSVMSGMRSVINKENQVLPFTEEL